MRPRHSRSGSGEPGVASQIPAKTGEIPALSRNGKAPSRGRVRTPVLGQRNRTSEEGRFVGHPKWVSQRAHFVLRHQWRMNNVKDPTAADARRRRKHIRRHGISASVPISGSSPQSAATRPRRPTRFRYGGQRDHHDPVRPTAIVSLSPTATEMLYAIGAGSQVKAVDSYSDYPKNAPRTKLDAEHSERGGDRGVQARPGVVAGDTTGLTASWPSSGYRCSPIRPPPT
jgi:hypothetical protein